MKKHRRIWGMVGLGLLVLLTASALSARTQIRVKDPAAVSRIEPAANGEIVQDKLAVGTVFTVERKTGEWFEVKYRSAIGVLLTGYIHESMVEEVKAEPEKKEPTAEPAPVALESYASGPIPGFELFVFGGLGMPQVKGVANYFDEWSGILYDVTENADINTKSQSSAFFGGGFNYFFSPNIGVGLNVGYLKSKLTTNSAFTYEYGSYTKTADWTGTDNSFTSIPVSLDLIGRFGSSLLQGYILAGPTIFMNDAIIDAAIGYGYSFLYYSYPYLYEFYDAVQIPMDAYDMKGGSGKTSWTGIGGNAGAGATFMISPSVGLNLEARYFFCPKREFDWTLITGTYPGLFVTSPSTTVQITSTTIDAIFNGNHLSTITINPSFFQITAGVKIKL